jgi:glutathione synthase/RimK-type ligase-like ATP-grasp enzyme
MSILIVGREEDPHTIAVVKAIIGKGENVRCLDAFRRDGFEINISKAISKASVNILETNGEDIKAIWLRQKPIIPLPWWGPFQHDAARFTQGEWRSVIQTLETFLPHAFWINAPEAQRWISYKPNQLHLAQQVGFDIPDTAITNNYETIYGFVNRHGKAIYKSLNGYVFSDQTGILTTVLNKDILEVSKESITQAPGIYQKFIEKKYEARVTVVGKQYFVAFIRTPPSGAGAVDWRHAQFENIFFEGEIPTKIASCIDKFQESSGIVYGAYDFIVSPDDNWYFLECNPAGQFLWLEHALGHKISYALAERLCHS